ncbi:hypothetical protein [Fluviicola taffensis]|uniref:hypothetical protein n=1 Tax=Fluviicola taffensis TaxID=191579 RepID=UPI00313832D8
MNKFFAFFVILALSSKLVAQDQPNLLSSTKVTTIGYWNKGDKVSYHVINSKTTTKSGSTEPVKKSSDTYDLEITVVDSTEHAYILAMKYLKGSGEGLEPQLQEIMNSIQTTAVIRYQTDEFGSFVKILNLIELQKDFQKTCNEFKKQVVSTRKPEEAKEVTATIDALSAQFSKPENIAVLYMSDILAIHAYYGIELVLNKPMETDLEFPCFANINVPGTGKITLSAINKAKDIATFSMVSKPDKEELKKYMKLFFDQLFPDSKGKIPVDQMSIDFENTERLVIHLSDGWMESVESSQTAIVSDSKEKVKKVSSKLFTRNN